MMCFLLSTVLTCPHLHWLDITVQYHQHSD